MEIKPLIIVVSEVVFSLALIFAAFSMYVNHGFGYQGDIILFLALPLSVTLHSNSAFCRVRTREMVLGK